MTIASEIQRINNNIASAYTACRRKGATIPVSANSSNLASCINTISGGGGSNTDLRPLIKSAWAWTNNNQGKCYFINHKNDQYNLMFGNFKKLVPNRATNYSGGYLTYILDGDFYLRDKYTNTYTKYTCAVKDWVSYTSVNNDGFAISENGTIYRFDLSKYYPDRVLTLIDDTGVWTKLSTFYNSATYGIRNGALCKLLFNDKTYSVIDDTGTWTDVCGLYAGVSGFGIKDGQVYYISSDGATRTAVTTDTGFTAISGSSYGLAIGNGALYYLSRQNAAKLLDNTKTWVKVAGTDMALTADGKLYYVSSNSVTQVGTDTTWTDICGQSADGGLGLNNGNVYYNLSSTKNLKQLTFSGDFTQIDGQYSTMSDLMRTCAIFISENATSNTLYTVAYPKEDYVMYFDKNLNTSIPIKVNSVANGNSYVEVMPSIDNEMQKYYRDTSKDGVFTTTPSEHQRTEELLDILEGQ